jgi:hypothetical protein
MRSGDTPAIFILGRGVGNFAGGPAGNLDAHKAPLGPHFFEFA